MLDSNGAIKYQSKMMTAHLKSSKPVVEITMVKTSLKARKCLVALKQKHKIQ